VPEPSDGERDRLGAFIDAAKARDVADDFIVALLKHKGWSERRVYGAFASYYERTLNVSLPERGARIEYASDAFLYLLAFISLGAWAFAAGYVFDALIDRLIPSGLDSAYVEASFRTQVAGELATILVALPIFAWVSRTISAGISRRPEMADSGVRKWLTYVALVITAMCLIGDGIWFLTSFLTGDLSLRFVLKTLVLVVLAGSIFTYYLSTVRGEALEPRRDRAYGALGVGLAALALVLGFFNVGTPAQARDIALDDRRVASLVTIAGRLHEKWSDNHRAPAPANLSGLNLQPDDLVDPQTQRPYEYRALGGTTYELCAVFSQSEPPLLHANYKHGRGRACFRRDAADNPFSFYN
jgi:hypothetical protein